ncbi:MAG: hypothetical protein ACE5EG_07690, partial [Thermoanaerobaculia bacterium]
MLEPSRLSRSWRWLAALLLASGLLLGGATAPLSAQEAEESPSAAEPVTPVPQEPPEIAEPEEPEEPAEPEEERWSRHRRHRRSDAQVIVGSSLVIEEDETSNEVVVIGGSLTVLGEVYGDAVAIGGAVLVEGRVTGDVAAVGGSVTVSEGAEVMGGAMSFGGDVLRQENAVIHGEVVEVTGPGMQWSMLPRFLSWGDWDDAGDWFHYTPFDWAWSQAWRIFCLAVLVLVAFLALLLGRTPIDRIGRRVEAEPWKSGLV